MKKLIILFGLLLVSVSTANGSLIQYDMTGLVSTSILSGVSAGDSWTATFTFDTTSPNVSGLTDEGIYQMNLPLDLNIGPTFTHHYSRLDVVVFNFDPGSPFPDELEVYGAGPGPNDLVQITLTDTTNTVFNSIDLPTSLNLSAFDFNSIALFINSVNVVRGTVATVTAVEAVPEPSTLLLLGAGLAGVGILRRKLRK